MPRDQRCSWDGCTNWRTDMLIETDRGPERYGLCDQHIKGVLAAVENNATESTRRTQEGLPARNGDRIPGWVYYLQEGDRIKVGFTTSLARRLRSYSPSARVLAVEPGTRATETNRHRLFKPHLAEGREWFHPHPDIDQWIAQVIERHGEPHVTRRLFAEKPTRAPIVAGKRSSTVYAGRT